MSKKSKELDRLNGWERTKAEAKYRDSLPTIEIYKANILRIVRVLFKLRLANNAAIADFMRKAQSYPFVERHGYKSIWDDRAGITRLEKDKK